MILVVLWAWKKGGGPERAIAYTMLAMELADRVNHEIWGSYVNFYSLDFGHLVIDMSVMIALLVVALLANRMYSLWIAGLQLITLSAHIARGAVLEITELSYALMVIVPSYLQLIILALGIGFHQLRFARYGNYRSWRSGGPASLKSGVMLRN